MSRTTINDVFWSSSKNVVFYCLDFRTDVFFCLSDIWKEYVIIKEQAGHGFVTCGFFPGERSGQSNTNLCDSKSMVVGKAQCSPERTVASEGIIHEYRKYKKYRFEKPD